MALEHLAAGTADVDRDVRPVLQQNVPPEQDHEIHLIVQLAEHLHDLGPDSVAHGRLRLSGPAGLVDAFHTAGQSLSVAAAARHGGKALGGVGGIGLQRGQFVQFEQLEPLGRPVPPEPCLFSLRRSFTVPPPGTNHAAGSTDFSTSLAAHLRVIGPEVAGGSFRP